MVCAAILGAWLWQVTARCACRSQLHSACQIWNAHLLRTLSLPAQLLQVTGHRAAPARDGKLLPCSSLHVGQPGIRSPGGLHCMQAQPTPTARLPAWLLLQVTSYSNSKGRDGRDRNAIATAQDAAGDIASAIASCANQLYQSLHEVIRMLVSCIGKLIALAPAHGGTRLQTDVPLKDKVSGRCLCQHSQI